MEAAEAMSDDAAAIGNITDFASMLRLVATDGLREIGPAADPDNSNCTCLLLVTGMEVNAGSHAKPLLGRLSEGPMNKTRVTEVQGLAFTSDADWSSVTGLQEAHGQQIDHPRLGAELWQPLEPAEASRLRQLAP